MYRKRSNLDIGMKNILLFLIKKYKVYVSPYKRSKCPYTPTCSDYGFMAIKKHGAARGLLLTVWRILRCNPFSHGGYDPVP